MKMAVFWVVAPCTLVSVYQGFSGLYCLHHQGDEWSLQPRMQPPTIFSAKCFTNSSTLFRCEVMFEITRSARKYTIFAPARLCATGVSSGLATKVTLNRVSWGRLECLLHWGKHISDFSFVSYHVTGFFCFVLNSTCCTVMFCVILHTPPRWLDVLELRQHTQNFIRHVMKCKVSATCVTFKGNEVHSYPKT
jgi:hypothetical protein